MKQPSVLFIAMDQDLTADVHVRKKLGNAGLRARRQSSRFKGLDLAAVQAAVHENLVRIQLQVDGVYMGLLDLVNTAKNNGIPPSVTPLNADSHLTMARMVTLNGIYFHQLLRQNGFSPRIIQNYTLERDLLSRHLEDRPLAAAISSNFLYLDDIREIARDIKKQAPDTPVIVGGALAKKVLEPGRGLKKSTLDWLNGFRGLVDIFIVESQGEHTFLNVLERMRNGGGIGGVPNLAHFNGGAEILFSDREEEPISMDETAIAWDRVPSSCLRQTIPINTSRGCMYTCRFCTYRKLVKGIHYKSLECLRKEMRLVEGLGFVNHVRFTDDNFTANPKRLKEVLNMMIEEDFSFSWSSFARSDAITPEIARLMRESKCDFLDMGIESGSAKILENMDKRLTVDKTKRAIELLNENSIYGAGAFIIGFPGETEATVQETVDLINSSGLPFYHLNLFYYSSGMAVYSQREEYGLEGLGLAWKHSTMDSVAASELISEMPGRIPNSYTDGLTSTWETFKILRGEGYSPAGIQKLYRLKKQLQQDAGGNMVSTKSAHCQAILRSIDSIPSG
jgi:radical SAM superfamily enzyme YgiQ (UPF0313 family)